MLKSSNSAPVSVTELVQLTHLGIPLEHITWARVTMTSDRWICIRHSENSKRKYSRGRRAITVLNPHHSFPETWESTASSAQMNPVKPLIAVRADLVFQIYNLETRSCLYKYKMLLPVLYWTWINSKLIAFVTDNSVFHWDLAEEKNVPCRAFNYHSNVTSIQFINYTADENMNWFALTGLTSEGNIIVGNTEIYSAEYNLTQPIQAHCVCFCQYQFEGNTQPSTVLIVANRGSEKTGKVHILELGPKLAGNFATISHSETIEFTDIWNLYDFPVSIQVSVKLGLAYIATKYGTLYIHDLETAAFLATHTICTDIVFTTAFHHDSQGILAISRNGQVLAVNIKKEALISHVQNVGKRPLIAERLRKISWKNA